MSMLIKVYKRNLQPSVVSYNEEKKFDLVENRCPLNVVVSFIIYFVNIYQ